MEVAIHSSLKMKNLYFFVSHEKAQDRAIGTRNLETSKFTAIVFRYDGTNFYSSSSSTYTHRDVIGLGNYNGQPFTTGGSSNTETEIFSISTDTWLSRKSYPFSNRYNNAKLTFTLSFYSESKFNSEFAIIQQRLLMKKFI